MQRNHHKDNDGAGEAEQVCFRHCRALDVHHGRLCENSQVWVDVPSGTISRIQWGERRGGGDEDDAVAAHPKTKVVDCQGAILSPGYIDIQLNGGWGVDFSNPQLTKAHVRKVARALPCHGVTSFCPTLISCTPQTYRQVLPVLRPLANASNGEAAAAAAEVEGAAILGVHLEGPFFAASKRGAHPETCIVDPTRGWSSAQEIYGIQNDNEKMISIVTLAPERPGALSLIQSLSERGIVASMGHSEANLEQGRDGARAGASLVTHLFNAMRPFHHREPGLLGLLLKEGNPTSNSSKRSQPERGPLFYSIIVDGIHSHPSAVQLAHTICPDGLVLITDAMAALGLGDGLHTLGESKVEVHGPRATVSGTETIAGSVQSMDRAVRAYREYTGCSIPTALTAATYRPATVLGMQDKRGALAEGQIADFVLLNDSLEVQETWTRGHLAFANNGRDDRSTTSKN